MATLMTMPTPDTPTSLQKVESPPDPGEEVEAQMTLMQHLTELRDRLVKASIALLVATAISFIFASRLVDILTIPVGGREMLQSIEVTENIGIFMRVSLISGVVLAMPVIVYQLIRFIVPGLTREERRYLWIVVPSASLLFLIGVAFAYFVMLRAALPFLLSFLDIPTAPRPKSYFGFVARLMFWIGVSFQTPLILAFLARLGVITPETLKKNRKYAIVVIALIAAAITPTVDPVNMMLVMVPLFLLYELGVFLSRLTYRPRQA
jgi:sec-independent protein translocase protein TatC